MLQEGLPEVQQTSCGFKLTFEVVSSACQCHAVHRFAINFIKAHHAAENTAAPLSDLGNQSNLPHAMHSHLSPPAHPS